MKYNNMHYEELLKNITDNKSAFLCGNGFSINFDERYKLTNLINKLYDVHCYLYNIPSNHHYDIISNEEFKKI